MSREEAMKALIESGMELRRDDIELGKKLERERIINAIESYRSEIPLDGMFDNIIGIDEVIALIKGEQK